MPLPFAFFVIHVQITLVNTAMSMYMKKPTGLNPPVSLGMKLAMSGWLLIKAEIPFLEIPSSFEIVIEVVDIILLLCFGLVT